MKKTIQLICISFLLIIGYAGCKKDNNNNVKENPLSSLGGSVTLPSGAAGALYAIENIVYDQTAGGSLDTLGSAFAWFNNYSSTSNAGSVTCNGDSLSTAVPFFTQFSYPWYTNSGSIISGSEITFSTNPVQWIVSGNSASGIAGFNFTDNSAFPVVSFSIPATVTITSGLTVNFTVTGTNVGIIGVVTGSKGQITRNLASTANTLSLSASDLNQVAISGGDVLTVEIMPVYYVLQTISGKSYYFVKQYAYAVSSLTQ